MVLAVSVVIIGCGVLFFLNLCQSPIYTIFLRSLETQDKSLGIGLITFSSGLLGKKIFDFYHGCIDRQ